jgi:hypothetical protein
MSALARYRGLLCTLLALSVVLDFLIVLTMVAWGHWLTAIWAGILGILCWFAYTVVKDYDGP